ncbi:hypothetical protein MPC4_60009 [Methylocella tundrae]|uniref:Uncharacterized protein n=1 Tax=Methylocella tundrae TaxID=227605 RepID=A0A8B6MAD8_METTU|nr:hypothetical protein MPC1_3150003 [Methylocella tundrae]VTZ51920.1 hypothetical protein MPC4_60009 [Methylocella tundrae]
MFRGDDAYSFFLPTIPTPLEFPCPPPRAFNARAAPTPRDWLLLLAQARLSFVYEGCLCGHVPLNKNERTKGACPDKDVARPPVVRMV